MDESYNFQRYLAAKQTVDDRSLNRYVLDRLVAHLNDQGGTGGLRILEAACGIGTMFERLASGGQLRIVSYLGVDISAANIHTARQRLPDWAARHRHPLQQVSSASYRLLIDEQPLEVRFQHADVLEMSSAGQERDLLIAHAFLDLVSLDRALPALFSLLKPGGAFYFTLNFDGLTILEPVIDRQLDNEIIRRYHHSMDQRRDRALPTGGSQSGRRLLSALPNHGARILAAGASDWIVQPDGEGRYPGDEAYFLKHILSFFQTSLASDPTLDGKRFQHWLQARRDQIEQGELIFIAHQLDVAGYLPEGTR